ncbi:MAG: SDR family oxidoreductase [Candidatus Omnitrophota bacterium]|nr:SDR family oxidoreductase [Candidatus Omnitrophota bacterium]
MAAKGRSVFLTGVTGALGRDFVKELLTTTDSQLFLLIRPQRRFSHWDRARKILASWGLEAYLGTRVQVMEGDVTSPNFGLADYDLDILRREVEEFYHIAALTALNGSREDCFHINVHGTQHALDLAEEFRKEGKLQRFFYFSTAFVAGSLQTYCAQEDELPPHPAHANHYEASKYAAESLVRKHMAGGLGVTIFRPSIVVGDSRTGEVAEFNVIYPFMKMFAHGILKTLPTKLDNTFNIVPIDFVIRAAAHIAGRSDSVGKTYHLVSQNPPSIGSLLRLKNEEYPQMPPIEVIAPEDFKREGLSAEEQMVYDMLSPYLGYLNDHLHFYTANTEAGLAGSGIEFPKTDYEFLKILTSYAVEAGYILI